MTLPDSVERPPSVENEAAKRRQHVASGVSPRILRPREMQSLEEATAASTILALCRLFEDCLFIRFDFPWLTSFLHEAT